MPYYNGVYFEPGKKTPQQAAAELQAPTFDAGKGLYHIASNNGDVNSYLPYDENGDQVKPATDYGYLRGREEFDPASGDFHRPVNWNNLIATAVGGEIAAPYVAGLFTGGGGASTTSGLGGEASITSSPYATGGLAANSAAGASGGAGGNMGILSKIGSAFGKKLDPTSLVLAGLSLLGGQPVHRQGFEGTGLTDPTQALNNSLQAIYRLGQGVTEQAPVRLRSSYVQPGPAPVNIPGLSFQIGGGMGRDPALDDPSLLQQQDRGNPFKYDPFQSLSQAGIPPQGQGVRRRNPNG